MWLRTNSSRGGGDCSGHFSERRPAGDLMYPVPRERAPEIKRLRSDDDPEERLEDDFLDLDEPVC